MERSATQFDAVYENGVLRPLEPVALPEHERLSVIVSRLADPLADVLDWDAHELAAVEGDESVSLEDFALYSGSHSSPHRGLQNQRRVRK